MDRDKLIERMIALERLSRQSVRSRALATPEEPTISVVGEAEFWARVSEEANRSDRYNHPFTVLIVRQQSTEGSRDLLGSHLIDAIEPGLGRGTDVVALMEGELAVAVLLPETTVGEAAALVERMRQVLPDRDICEFALMEYPADAQDLEAVRVRAA